MSNEACIDLTSSEGYPNQCGGPSETQAENQYEIGASDYCYSDLGNNVDSCQDQTAEKQAANSYEFTGDGCTDRVSGENCRDQPHALTENQTAYNDAYGDDQEIFCELCQCSMTGPKTYEEHVNGARHKKNLTNSEYESPPARTNRGSLPQLRMKDGKRVTWEPRCKEMIDSFDQPLIGLQFVTEWRHKNRLVEERYYCHLCKAKCDVRMLTSHLTGFKHRLAFMKMFHPEMAVKVREEEVKSDQPILAEVCARQIEEKEGRKPVRVKVEGFPGYQGDEDDKDMDEFINENRQNYTNYLRNLDRRPTWQDYSSRSERGTMSHFPQHFGCGPGGASNIDMRSQPLMDIMGQPQHGQCPPWFQAVPFTSPFEDRGDFGGRFQQGPYNDSRERRRFNYSQGPKHKGGRGRYGDSFGYRRDAAPMPLIPPAQEEALATAQTLLEELAAIRNVLAFQESYPGNVPMNRRYFGRQYPRQH